MSIVNAKCPNCGASIQLDDERKEGFCSYCGSKVEVEEAQKLMIQGTVKVDTSDELANLYQIARRARDTDNSENAHKYYDMILVKDPNSWEANFFVTYYQAMQCKIAGIASAANSITNCEASVLELIKSTVPREEQKDAIIEIYARLSVISAMFFSAAKSHYEGIDLSIRHKFAQDYINNAAYSADMMYIFGNRIIAVLGDDDEFGAIASLAWQKGIDIHKEYIVLLQNKDNNVKLIEDYVKKIQKYDPTYKQPEIKTSEGCYVATSIYGSYDCPQVWTLRRFRDDTLDASWFGRCFIKTYYAISPTLVKWFGESAIFKGVFTPVLDKMVNSLKDKGVSDKPYSDKY